MGSRKGSKGNIPPEAVVINPQDVGLLSDVLEVEEAEVPREAPKVEKISLSDNDIVMDKVPDNLQKRFVQIFRALEPFATKEITHSPGSRRHHFKPVSAVLFYGKNPVLDLAVDHGKGKKHTRERFKVTKDGLIDSDGNKVTQKSVIDMVKAYKKARGK